MSEKKHIDQLFKDKLKNLDVKPDHSVWDRINTGLENNNQKNVMPLWLRLSAVAAGITLLFLIGNSIFNSEDATRPTLVDTHENSEDLNEKPLARTNISCGIFQDCDYNEERPKLYHQKQLENNNI